MAALSHEKSVAEALTAMDGQVCFPVDWFKEDLPVENKQGNALDKVLEGWYNDAALVPKTVENFVRAPNIQVVTFPVPPQPPRENVLVFSDSHGYCRRILAAAPEGRVGTKKIVEQDAWYSMSEGGVADLIRSQKGGWDMVVFAAGLEPPASSHVHDVIDHQNVVIRLYLDVLKATQKSENVRRVAVVTAGVFSDDPLDHQMKGLGLVSSSVLFGMTNSARLELEEVVLHFIDSEPSLAATGDNDRYNIFPRVATELFRLQTFGHNTVRILNGGRYVLRQLNSAPYREAHCDFSIPKEGVVAISGGNGALGLVMGEWLLRKCEQHGVGSGLTIQFLSRSAKIAGVNAPLWQKVEEKAASLGVQVVQAKADMSSQENVDRYVSSVSPSLVGFIHSAGVLQDAMLANLTWEKCEAVFDSKHRAALYLHSALERIPNPSLGFFWMFSSIAVWGSMGQINYSGSNAFLDALCRHRRAIGKPATAIQWGAWGEVGMAATMSESMRARTMAGPMPYFSNAEALLGLEQGLQTGLPLFSVFKFNPGVVLAMIRPADSAQACYFRNFTSEIFPPPLVENLERHHMYSAFRAAHGPYSAIQGIERLHYDRFTRPSMERYEEEWGDDFRKWAPLAA